MTAASLRPALVAITLGLCAHAASAAQISAKASIVGQRLNGDPVDVALSADTDPLSLSRIETVTGAQTGTVLGFVNVSGSSDGSFALSAFGQRASTNRASYHYSGSFTNDSAGMAAWQMAFHIAPGALETKIFEPANAADDRYRAGYDLAIRVGGGLAFASSASLFQGGALNTAGTSLAGVLQHDAGAPDRWRYSYDAYDGTLDLGVLGPGESVAIAYDVAIFALFNGSDCSGNCGAVSATFGDPFSAGGTSVIGAASQVTLLPLPGAVWLLVSALGSLFLSAGRVPHVRRGAAALSCA